MSWPNPLRRRDENTRTAWGHTFQLTPEHLTAEQAEPLKHSYDTLGEECYNILNERFPPAKPTMDAEVKESQTPLPTESPSASLNGSAKPPPKPKRDLYILLREHHESHPSLDKLWHEVNTIPSWVDWDQIARGQDVFYRYGGATLTGLTYQSLLGGMGANRVVETLARTGGFSVKVARHRLFETTQHILECTRDLESIKPGGAGFASSLRVRLLHAAVRNRILKLEKARPGYYDVQKYGIPINDLDCMGTIGTFSATIIWLSLPRQGIWMREQEIHDYNALWRLIAYYMGTPTEWFETPSRAKVLMQSLLLSEVNPSQTSRVMANNVIRCLENTPPMYTSRSFLEVNARWLNGNELCDALGLGQPGWYYWALMAGQCIFFSVMSYIYRSVPILDKRKVAWLKQVFWAMIIKGEWGLGQETVFDFKYVPDYGVDTYMGKDQEVKVKGSSVERRNLQTLVVATGFLAFVGYVSVKIAAAGIRRLF